MPPQLLEDSSTDAYFMSLIAAIEGFLETKEADHVLVRVGGVTFQVSVPTSDISRLGQPGDVVRLNTYLVVREDDLHLYGFVESQGSRMFQLLLEVSGVGPRVALGVLSVLSPEVVASAVTSGDTATISRAPGVGKRTAERIIVELKDRLGEEFTLATRQPMPGVGGDEQDRALRALVALGYTAFEARQALSMDQEEGLAVEERVRRSLQRMAG